MESNKERTWALTTNQQNSVLFGWQREYECFVKQLLKTQTFKFFCCELVRTNLENINTFKVVGKKKVFFCFLTVHSFVVLKIFVPCFLKQLFVLFVGHVFEKKKRNKPKKVTFCSFRFTATLFEKSSFVCSFQTNYLFVFSWLKHQTLSWMLLITWLIRDLSLKKTANQIVGIIS